MLGSEVVMFLETSQRSNVIKFKVSQLLSNWSLETVSKIKIFKTAKNWNKMISHTCQYLDFWNISKQKWFFLILSMFLASSWKLDETEERLATPVSGADWINIINSYYLCSHTLPCQPPPSSRPSTQLLAAELNWFNRLHIIKMTLILM